MPRQTIETFQLPNKGDEHLELVLCNVGGYHPFVTWLHNRQQGADGYFWGRYHEKLIDAAKDFEERKKENGG